MSVRGSGRPASYCVWNRPFHGPHPTRCIACSNPCPGVTPERMCAIRCETGEARIQLDHDPRTARRYQSAWSYTLGLPRSLRHCARPAGSLVATRAGK